MFESIPIIFMRRKEAADSLRGDDEFDSWPRRPNLRDNDEDDDDDDDYDVFAHIHLSIFFLFENVKMYIIAVQSDDDVGGNAKKSAVQMLLFSATMVSIAGILFS